MVKIGSSPTKIRDNSLSLLLLFSTFLENLVRAIVHEKIIKGITYKISRYIHTKLKIMHTQTPARNKCKNRNKQN